MTYMQADRLPGGARTKGILAILEKIVEADGEPQKFDQVCEDVGIKYPGDYLSAMTSLEVAGVVIRYTYVEQGSTKSKNAYALNKEAPQGDPTTVA